MCNPFSSARRFDARGVIFPPVRAASFSSSGMRLAVDTSRLEPRIAPWTTCSFGRRSRGADHAPDHAQPHTRPQPGPLPPRADRRSTAHRRRLLRRSAALSASRLRATSNAPRHALPRPHGEPPVASERRPTAAHATPQPRRERPRADRCRCSPRPPHGAIRGSNRVSGVSCVRRAAARPAATTCRAKSRVGASAHGRICHAAAEARAAARGSLPMLTTAASIGVCLEAYF